MKSPNTVVGERFKPTKPRGLVSIPRMQGGGSATELGGIMEVAMLGFDLGWGIMPTMLCWF
jgi:hypothetical protein